MRNYYKFILINGELTDSKHDTEGENKVTDSTMALRTMGKHSHCFLSKVSLGQKCHRKEVGPLPWSFQ